MSSPIGRSTARSGSSSPGRMAASTVSVRGVTCSPGAGASHCVHRCILDQTDFSAGSAQSRRSVARRWRGIALKELAGVWLLACSRASGSAPSSAALRTDGSPSLVNGDSAASGVRVRHEPHCRGDALSHERVGVPQVGHQRRRPCAAQLDDVIDRLIGRVGIDGRAKTTRSTYRACPAAARANAMAVTTASSRSSISSCSV